MYNTNNDVRMRNMKMNKLDWNQLWIVNGSWEIAVLYITLGYIERSKHRAMNWDNIQVINRQKENGGTPSEKQRQLMD